MSMYIFMFHPNKMRSSFDAVKFTKSCFFCGKGDSETGQLFSCRTESLDKQVREWADDLCS